MYISVIFLHLQICTKTIIDMDWCLPITNWYFPYNLLHMYVTVPAWNSWKTAYDCHSDPEQYEWPEGVACWLCRAEVMAPSSSSTNNGRGWALWSADRDSDTWHKHQIINLWVNISLNICEWFELNSWQSLHESNDLQRAGLNFHSV